MSEVEARGTYLQRPPAAGMERNLKGKTILTLVIGGARRVRAGCTRGKARITLDVDTESLASRSSITSTGVNIAPRGSASG